MNIFKLVIQSIKLKLYLKIAKRNLRIIQEFEKQKEHLNEIMTTYKVENKLVELKVPTYEYYKAFVAVLLNDTLKNEIAEVDIPKDVTDIKIVKNPFEISKPGYYCVANKIEENFAIIDGEKHPLEKIAAGLPYTEIYSERDKYENGYYKKYTAIKKYYFAENKVNLKKINLIDIPEEERINIKLVDDTSYIDKEGYYKVIV